MKGDADVRDGGIRPGALVGGAVLLALGGSLLLDRTGLFRAPFGQLIGPFVLIAMGAAILVEQRNLVCGSRPATDGGEEPRASRRGAGTGGLWLMGIGVWLLVSQLHLWGLNFQNSWPLIVILSGAIMLVKGIR